MASPSDRLTPFRWPKAWTGTRLIESTPFNCVVADAGAAAPPAAAGLKVVTAAPPGVLWAEGVSPGVKTAEQKSESRTADAGPTGRPWIESNAWLFELERVRNPKQKVWLTYRVEKPPGRGSRFYELAVAEAAAYGGDWVVELDPDLAGRLVQGDADARRQWDRISATVKHFAERPWSGWQPVARVGVVSTFEGEAEYMGTEMLNLSLRRLLPVVALPVDKAVAAAWADLRAIVYPDEAAPVPALREKLRRFAVGGGLVFSNVDLGKVAGKGRIIVPEDKWMDPWALAQDVHMTLGREHDVYRLYNATAANVHYVRSADGKRGAVHLINYTGRGAGHPPTLALGQAWKGARVSTLEAPEPEAIAPRRVRYGVEIPLPNFAVYARVDLEA